MALSALVRLSNPDVVQGHQLRAARALLDWSTPVAATKCGVGVNTISRFEKGHRAPGSEILRAIVSTFEENGVLFIDSEIGSGVIRNDRAAGHG